MTSPYPDRPVVIDFTVTGTLRVNANNGATNDEIRETLREAMIEEFSEQFGVGDPDSGVLSHHFEVDVKVEDA